MSIPDIDRPSQLTRALLGRLCTPEALDPTNPVHCTGFAHALQHDPTLPAPRDLVRALDDRELWQVVQQPPASAELQRRLTDPDTRVDTPTKDDEILTTPLFPSLETAIVSTYRARRLNTRDIERLKKRFALRPATLRALADITQQRESRRRPRQPSAAAPSLLDTIHEILPLDGAKTYSGSDWRLWDLPLERLTAQELATLLPKWLQCDRRYVAPLLNVPGLDPDIQALVFQAWIDTHCYRCPRQPIPLHLVEATTAPLLAPVLRLFFRDDINITPPPTQQFLDNLIFLVALDNPQTAAELRQARTLAAWQDTLLTLIETDLEAPTATDPDARWLALHAKDANTDSEKVVQMSVRFNQESLARQRALAPIILATIRLNALF